MMFLQFLLLLSPIVIAVAVDPGGGTYSCYPCARSTCYLANTDVTINVEGWGRETCGTFQKLADARSLFPDECAALQVPTLGPSDPCGCTAYGGGACPEAGWTNDLTCNLCGANGMRIGDPDKIIKGGKLNGTPCITAFDNSEGYSTICDEAAALVQDQCKCVEPGQAVNTCKPVEDNRFTCNPNEPTNSCCDGSCKWRDHNNAYVCTTRSGDTPPSGSGNAPPPFVTCFSGDMKVVTAAKGSISMKDLTIGDRVLVGDNKFDTVYSFGHRSESKEASFLSIINDRSLDALELSRDHMVFTNQGQAVPAASLEKGDTMLLPSGELATIVRINTVTRKGAYAPFTYSGALVVNGVVASSFIALQETNEKLQVANSQMPLTFQWLAHAFEAPHRMGYRLGLVPSETYSIDGVSHWVETPYMMSKWIVVQSSMIQSLILIPTVAIMAAVWCVEQNFFIAAALLGVLLLARSRRVLKKL